MKTPQTLRIMNYAVNGIGLGHLSRLIAVNRWMRRYTSVLGIDADILFLTSSEADALCYHNGFPAFKIPSKTIISDAHLPQRQAALRLSRARYRQLAKQWVWNSVGVFAPDILVVDTFPNGSLHELGSIADFGMKKVLISRAVREKESRKPDFYAALRMYDRIITTQEPFSPSQHLPDEVQGRTVSVETIMLREREELRSRQEARQYLGLPESAMCIYVSAGGGGDSEAESSFQTLAALAADMPNIHFVCGAGALYRGREFYAPNLRWLQRFNMMELLPAFDGALSAGGYNSVYELLVCGIPTVFLAQERLFDDQHHRITALQEKGLCTVFPAWNEHLCREAIEKLCTQEWRESIRKNIAAFSFRNDAQSAARYTLELSLGENELRRADELLESSVFFTLIREGFDERLVLRTFYLLDFEYRRHQQQRKALLMLNLDDSEQTPILADVPESAAYFLRECRKLSIEPLSRLQSVLLPPNIAEISTMTDALERLLTTNQDVVHL